MPGSCKNTSSAYTDAASRSCAQSWTDNKRKGIWLKIPLSHAELVPAAAKQGFEYHHAEPTYVMMTRWLPQTENKLPTHSTHQVRLMGGRTVSL